VSEKLRTGIIACILLLIFTSTAVAQTVRNGDANNDGQVTSADIVLVFQNFLASLTTNTDQFGDGRINALDVARVIKMLPSGVPSATPTPTQQVATEWTQFGHDAQRTNFTTQTVPTQWKYKWQWNGAGADGKKQANHLASPKLVQPITGGNRVYTVAANAVYALSKDTGGILWSNGSIGTLQATPVYDAEFLYVPSGNQTLYKLNASSGAIVSSFTATSGFTLAPLSVGNYLYAVSDAGVLYKVDKATMSKVWEYTGGSPGVTVAAYSSSRNAIVFVTQDLYVHAVNNTDGSRKWRIKPTVRSYSVQDQSQNLTEAINGWPVIAEQHGIVFVRYRLEWQTLWNGPAAGGTYPELNADARSFLIANPREQVLFAMKLDDGSTAFIPNVGNAGAGDGGRLPMGTMPTIYNNNGTEIAYIVFRNRQNCARFNFSYCDGRSDAIMGEMVLHNTTVPGYVAGDVRIVNYEDIRTDEAMNVTMSGSTLFHSHWLVNAAKTITDRSASLGNSFANGIKTTNAPYVIWRQVYCPPDNSQCNPQIFPGGSGFSYGPSNCPFNQATRYCSAGLYGYGDQRGYPPGFYEYHNDNNSGTTPFTTVSSGLVLIKTNDGAIIALENGNPTARSNEQIIARQQETPKVLGDTSQLQLRTISYPEAGRYIGQNIRVEGRIISAVNHRPKAVYLGFTDPHDGALLVRVFEKDIVQKFDYDPMILKGKRVRISGFVTPYWPEGVDPEIIISDPKQIEILD
jgi:hypothetical protein